MPLCQAKHLAEEGTSHRFVEQAVTILRETAVIPNLVVHVEANKPAIEQVEVDVVHQLTLGTNRVQRLNQTGAQQPLRRNRRATRIRVQGLEVRMQCRQNAVHQRPVAEHLRLGHIRTEHEITIPLNSNGKSRH